MMAMAAVPHAHALAVAVTRRFRLCLRPATMATPMHAEPATLIAAESAAVHRAAMAIGVLNLKPATTDTQTAAAAATQIAQDPVRVLGAATV